MVCTVPAKIAPLEESQSSGRRTSTCAKWASTYPMLISLWKSVDDMQQKLISLNKSIQGSAASSITACKRSSIAWFWGDACFQYCCHQIENDHKAKLMAAIIKITKHRMTPLSIALWVAAPACSKASPRLSGSTWHSTGSISLWLGQKAFIVANLSNALLK